MTFVNRQQELEALERWWDSAGAAIGLVWGRRRVGKTALVETFAEGRRAIFHTGSGRPAQDELAALSRQVATALPEGIRDLAERPFVDWTDAFETLAAAADEPLLLVLDEFPELVSVAPELPSALRAVWDRARRRSQLRVLLCGSAVRTMQALAEERSPLYGRLDLQLAVHPFGPHEAAAMLPSLDPGERAVVWGIVGGMPLYLEWWDDRASLQANVHRLACTPGGLLLTEGQLVLATEADAGDLSRQILYAIAAGRTRFNEIESAVRADPGRSLERLVNLRLVERVAPVTEDPRRTRRRIYRIADNFLAFWLGLLDRHRAEIERGLGASILPVLVRALDDHMGTPWEEAFRQHLRLLAGRGELGHEVTAVGPFWTAARDPSEIDAVALAGRSPQAVLTGEAKWAKTVDGRRIVTGLERKAAALPKVADRLRHAVCAREEVRDAGEALVVTAEDIFGG